MRAEWSDSLASGHSIIDGQHKELFGHINSYFESLEKVYGHEVTIKTLNFLVKYVRFHFGTEEDLMKQSNYPDFKNHLEAHRKIVDELMTCYKLLITDGHSEEIVERLRTLLQVWFVDHIMGFDMRLAKFIKEKSL